jgi:hypothetical protein
LPSCKPFAAIVPLGDFGCSPLENYAEAKEKSEGDFTPAHLPKVRPQAIVRRAILRKLEYSSLILDFRFSFNGLEYSLRL